MKELIENYISNSKKLTIQIFDLEQSLKKHFQKIKPTFYKELAETILQLEKEEKISPITSSKSYSMDGRIVNKYRKIKKNSDKSITKEILSGYHPRMKMVEYIQNPLQYEMDRKYLIPVSDFLTQAAEDEDEISVNERSFELFDNEKYLSSQEGVKLMVRIGLSNADLQCYETYEPFFYYRIPETSETSILIVENKDTFFTLKKLFSSGTHSWDAVSFGMLIYGEGNKITRSIHFLDELKIPKNTPIYYFGDLDPEGLSIYHRLTKIQDRPIQLFSFFYQEMWKRRKNMLLSKEHRWVENAVNALLPCFDDKDQDEVIGYLKEKKYVPQEALSFITLRRLSDGVS